MFSFAWMEISYFLVLSWFREVTIFFTKSCSDGVCRVCWERVFLSIVDTGKVCILYMSRRVRVKLSWVGWLSWRFFLWLSQLSVVKGEVQVLEWWCQSCSDLSSHLLIERLQSCCDDPSTSQRFIVFLNLSCSDVVCRACLTKKFLHLVGTGGICRLFVRKNPSSELSWVGGLSWCFFFMVSIHVVHGDDLVLEWQCISMCTYMVDLLTETFQSSHAAPSGCWKVHCVSQVDMFGCDV